MPVFRAVVHQQQQARRGQALHQAVEQGLGLGVDPVQILEDQQQGLLLALPQDQTLHGLQGLLAALRRIEDLPGGVLHRHVQQRQEDRQGWPQGVVQGQ
jgi:hypothetical protein